MDCQNERGVRIPCLGISTTLDYSIPFNEMLPMIREAGFSAVALGGGDVGHSGYDTSSGREKIRSVLAETGLFLDSIHAPFGKTTDISSGDPERRNRGCEGVVAALEACNQLGASVAVVHLNSWLSRGEEKARTRAITHSLEELIPQASDLGVRIAAENLYGGGAMSILKDALASYPELEVCYDSSHAHLHSGHHPDSPYQVLDEYPERISALHLSDVARDADDHLPPYTGKIDWREFCRHLAMTAYTGTLLLELNMESTSFRDPSSFLREAYGGATRLLETFEEEVNRGG